MALTGLLVGLVFLFAVSDGASNQNATIECVFRNYKFCYNGIPSLGANFSVLYDQTEGNISNTCRLAPSVNNCIRSIPSGCPSGNMNWVVNKITQFISNVCANRTLEHTSFLNSSQCYNKNINRRQKCMKDYDPGSKTDAKSLCCSNARRIRCINKDMKKYCPKNTTDFQKTLMETYTLHHSTLCAPYVKKYCNTAAALIAPIFTVTVAALASALLRRF